MEPDILSLLSSNKIKVTQSEMFVNLHIELFSTDRPVFNMFSIALNSAKSCAKTWRKRGKYHDTAIKRPMRSLSPFRSISVYVLPSLKAMVTNQKQRIFELANEKLRFFR